MKSTGREVKNSLESLTAGLKQPEKSSTYAEREVRAMGNNETQDEKGNRTAEIAINIASEICGPFTFSESQEQRQERRSGHNI